MSRFVSAQRTYAYARAFECSVVKSLWLALRMLLTGSTGRHSIRWRPGWWL
jgi:hypothetical protein